jgi:O-antigen ligase
LGFQVGLFAFPLLVSACCWGYDFWFSGGRIRWNNSWFLLAAMAALILLAALFSPYQQYRWVGSPDEQAGLIQWAGFALLAFLLFQLLDSSTRLRQLAVVFVVIGFYCSVLSLLEVGGIVLLPAQETDTWVYNRGIATFGNPDFLGLFLVCPALLSFGLVGQERGRKRRIALAFAAVLITVALFLTQTRAAWFGWIAGMLVFSILVIEKKSVHVLWRPSTLAACTVSALSVIAATAWKWDSILERVLSIFVSLTSAHGLSGRVGLWHDYALALMKRPLLGFGPDTFTPVWQSFATTFGVQAMGSSVTSESPHNVLLDVAVQFGIPCMVLFVVFVSWVVLRGIRRACHMPEKNRLVAAWFAMLCGTLVTAVASKFVFQTTLPFVVCLVAGSVLAFPVKRQTIRPASHAVAAVVLSGAFLFGGYGVLSFISSVMTNHAESEQVVVFGKKVVSAYRLTPWRGYSRHYIALALEGGVFEDADDQAAVGMTRREAESIAAAVSEPIAFYSDWLSWYYLDTSHDTATAAQWAKHSTELRPLYVDGYLSRAYVSQSVADTGTAEAHYKTAVKLEQIYAPSADGRMAWLDYLDFLITNEQTQKARVVLLAFEKRYSDAPELAELRDVLSE